MPIMTRGRLGLALFLVPMLPIACRTSHLAITHDAPDQSPTSADLHRVTTMPPFPRGLSMVDDELYVLCRGRVRGAGGVSAEVEDQAGTIYVVDPEIAEPVANPEAGAAVRSNGRVFARPTDPPFRLWDRDAQPPESDRRTDRPYCTLRYHPGSRNFFLCAFSGIDQPKKPGEVSFSKNLADGLLRYDARTDTWHEVERHHPAAGGSYPHHEVDVRSPPHGWLNGPDNCLVVGDKLYAVAKDNSLLVQYDLAGIIDDPAAPPPHGRVIMGSHLATTDGRSHSVYGHSALAVFAHWLYVACRTSSVIYRIPLDDRGEPLEPVVGQIVARFEPYDPVTRKSANITDMGFDDEGRLYVVSAKPSRLYRFVPDAGRVFDGREAEPWADLAAMTGNPRMKSENVLVDGHRVFITSGDGYSYQRGADGTVYRLDIPRG